MMNLSSEEKLMKKVDMNRLPAHIAIVMDGNGRWAKKRGLRRVEGHRAGIRSVKKVVRLCNDLKIQILTLYAFSTENWKRPRAEVAVIMSLLKTFLRKEIKELNANHVKLTAIGRLSELPSPALRELKKCMKMTSQNDGLILNLAINYGGRADIIDGIKKLAADIQNGKRTLQDIDEDLFNRYLYTSGLPDPELFIRTSGEMRVSNFLLWQISYAEIFVTPVYWPDFGRENLLQAIIDYQMRERRFGDHTDSRT
jgi:undecaprenyl diphosphate synthase